MIRVPVGGNNNLKLILPLFQTIFPALHVSAMDPDIRLHPTIPKQTALSGVSSVSSEYAADFIILLSLFLYLFCLRSRKISRVSIRAKPSRFSPRH